VTITAAPETKNPFSLRENGFPISLAAFVERPQAELQIGAVMPRERYPRGAALSRNLRS